MAASSARSRLAARRWSWAASARPVLKVVASRARWNQATVCAWDTCRGRGERRRSGSGPSRKMRRQSHARGGSITTALAGSSWHGSIPSPGGSCAGRGGSGGDEGGGGEGGEGGGEGAGDGGGRAGAEGGGDERQRQPPRRQQQSQRRRGREEAGNTSLVRTRLPTNYPGPRTNRESIASVVASCHTSSRHKQRAHILPHR